MLTGFARDLAAVVRDIRASGQLKLRAMAAELNRRGMPTRRGGRWHVSNVRNLLARVDPIQLTEEGSWAQHLMTCS